MATVAADAINIDFLYSVLASILGYALLYSYTPVKLKFTEFIRNIITVCIIGVVALLVSQSYYPANSEMVNITVIPFISGFVFPRIIAGVAVLLQLFSKKPTEGLSGMAKLISIIKGNIPKDDNKDGGSQ